MIFGQVAMWLASGLLAYLVLGLPFLVGLLVGATVTPTDPVIASTITSGETARKNTPERIRNLHSAGSGANDGGAYSLVFWPFSYSNTPSNTPSASG